MHKLELKILVSYKIHGEVKSNSHNHLMDSRVFSHLGQLNDYLIMYDSYYILYEDELPNEYSMGITFEYEMNNCAHFFISNFDKKYDKHDNGSVEYRTTLKLANNYVCGQFFCGGTFRLMITCLDDNQTFGRGKF